MRGQRVNAVLAVLLLAIELAAHRVRFPRSGLAVREARGHAALEDRVDQRFSRVFVDHFVGARIVEGIVEAEFVILQVFGEVHLGFGFVHDHLIAAGHTDYVELLLHQLLAADRSFADAHRDLVVFDGRSVGQRPEIDVLLEFAVGLKKKITQKTLLVIFLLFGF